MNWRPSNKSQVSSLNFITFLNKLYIFRLAWLVLGTTLIMHSIIGSKMSENMCRWSEYTCLDWCHFFSKLVWKSIPSDEKQTSQDNNNGGLAGWGESIWLTGNLSDGLLLVIWRQRKCETSLDSFVYLKTYFS